jgi:hypothetical protein
LLGCFKLGPNDVLLRFFMHVAISHKTKNSLYKEVAPDSLGKGDNLVGWWTSIGNEKQEPREDGKIPSLLPR